MTTTTNTTTATPVAFNFKTIVPQVTLMLAKKLNKTPNIMLAAAAHTISTLGAEIIKQDGQVSEEFALNWITVGLDNLTKRNNIRAMSADKLLTVAIENTFFNMDDEVLTITESLEAILVTVSGMVAQSAAITEETRRTDYVKGGQVTPSPLMKKAIETLESTAYSIDNNMLSIIKRTMSNLVGETKRTYLNDGKSSEWGTLAKARDIITTEAHVITGATETQYEKTLFSEYFADKRGRLYHFACAGANPQSSDLSRSLYSLAEADMVKAGSAAHDIFINELADISSDSFMNNMEKASRAIVANPVASLQRMLMNKAAGKPTVKKPFTVVKMAHNVVEFIDNGESDVRVGLGFDAKCSGTQYYSILAGDNKMMRATGVTTEAGKVADPYMIAVAQMQQDVVGTDLEQYGQYLTRAWMKTPYMAIQYGGGAGAVAGASGFATNCAEFGVTDTTTIMALAKAAKAAIEKALGNRIMTLREQLTEACTNA